MLSQCLDSQQAPLLDFFKRRPNSSATKSKQNRRQGNTLPLNSKNSNRSLLKSYWRSQINTLESTYTFICLHLSPNLGNIRFPNLPYYKLSQSQAQLANYLFIICRKSDDSSRLYSSKNHVFVDFIDLYMVFKQAPHAWNFNLQFLKMGLNRAIVINHYFSRSPSRGRPLLLVYVDDISDI